MGRSRILWSVIGWRMNKNIQKKEIKNEDKIINEINVYNKKIT